MPCRKSENKFRFSFLWVSIPGGLDSIRFELFQVEILPLIVEKEIDNTSVPSEVWKTTLCTKHQAAKVQGFIQETEAH